MSRHMWLVILDHEGSALVVRLTELAVPKQQQFIASDFEYPWCGEWDTVSFVAESPGELSVFKQIICCALSLCLIRIIDSLA